MLVLICGKSSLMIMGVDVNVSHRSSVFGFQIWSSLMDQLSCFLIFCELFRCELFPRLGRHAFVLKNG